VSERQKAEAAVLSSLREKEALLREIHHRVKNNLAVVCSLLYLQSTRTEDAATQRILQESQDRVRSMALVHESLYRSDNLAEVNFGEYAQNLIASLFRAYGPAAARLTVQTNIAPVRLTIERAVPLGLVLNELMTNALKHAFPGERTGVVRAALRQEGDELCLCVTDNGVGLPAGFDAEQVPSLGLRLIQILARQLDGQFRIAPANPGAEARLTLRRTHERSPS
jgi:two-component sensor histidine kinase